MAIDIDKDVVIKLTSRHIAKCLDNLHRLSEMEKGQIKRSFRHLQEDFIALSDEETQARYKQGSKNEQHGHDSR